MASNFQRIIERAKQKGEAKLQIIAPKFSVPEKVASEKLKRKRSSSRRRSSQPTSTPSQPAPTPTPQATPPQQSQQPTPTQAQAVQQAALQRQRNLAFIQRVAPEGRPTPTPPPRPNIIQEARIRAQVVRQGVGEVKVGVAKAGIGIAETSVNLFSLFGVQTITPGQEQNKFKFGGELGRIRDQPSTTLTTAGQVAVFAPLVISGGVGFVSTARAGGVGMAVRETALAFSPLKIRTGSYGALETQRQIQRLKFDVISTKQTKGDFTFRRTIGQARDDSSVKLVSSQVSKGFGSKEVGRTTTDIIAPRVTLRAGDVTTGFRAIRTETAFAGARGSGALTSGRISVPLSSLQTSGTISQTKTILNVVGDDKGIQTVFTPLGRTTPGSTGTLLQKQPSYSKFTSGTGTKSLKVTRQSFTERIKVSSLNVRGLEFDITSSTKTFTPSSTSNLPKSSLALKQTTSPAVITTPKTISLPKLTQSSSVVAALGIKRSPVAVAQPQSTQVFKQKQTPITTTTPIQTTTPTTTTETKVTPITVQAPREKSSQRRRQTPAIAQIPAQVQIPQQEQIPAQIQTPKQVQVPRQIQRQRFFPTSPGRVTPQPQPSPTRTPFSVFFPPVSSSGARPQQSFTTFGRRFGKFKVIGTSRTQRGAITKGRRFATQTLGATFKVPGAKEVKIPGFTTKKKKGEILFTEKKERRLKKGTKELPEIQFFKRMKGGKKK